MWMRIHLRKHIQVDAKKCLYNPWCISYDIRVVCIMRVRAEPASESANRCGLTLTHLPACCCCCMPLLTARARLACSALCIRSILLPGRHRIRKCPNPNPLILAEWMKLLSFSSFEQNRKEGRWKGTFFSFYYISSHIEVECLGSWHELH